MTFLFFFFLTVLLVFWLVLPLLTAPRSIQPSNSETLETQPRNSWWTAPSQVFCDILSSNMAITDKLCIDKPCKFYKYSRTIIEFVISQWFYVFLAALIAIAAKFPNFARHGGLIKAQYTIGYLAVALIFFQNGLSMRTSVFFANLYNWRAHIIAILMQFFITGSLIFALCTAVKSAQNPNIDNWMLMGAIVTSTCPTTIASNVVMTRSARGNFELSISSVFVGNLLGAFISPLLLQMYTSCSAWSFGNPSNGTGFTNIYSDVMKQLGCSVFVPLFIGQCVNNINPDKVLAFNAKYKLNKVGSICLLLNLFASFSTAFYQHAFTSVPGASIIMIFFFNAGMYLFFTIITMALTRNFILHAYITDHVKPKIHKSVFHRYLYRALSKFYFDPPDATALLFICPAKTAALGIGLTTSQYGDDFEYLGKLLAALVLYQTEQVLIANFLVIPARKWNTVWRKEQLEKDSSDETDDDLLQNGRTESVVNIVVDDQNEDPFNHEDLEKAENQKNKSNRFKSLICFK